MFAFVSWTCDVEDNQWMISVLPSRSSVALSVDGVLRYFQWDHAILVVYALDSMYVGLAAEISTTFARPSLPQIGTTRAVQLIVEKIVNVDGELSNIETNMAVVMQHLEVKGILI